MHMKKLILLAILTIFIGSNALAMMPQRDEPPIRPPETNPHPPSSKADINRVMFADAVINNLLKSPYPKTSKEDLKPLLKKKGLALNLDRNCIEKKLCWSAKNEVSNYIQAIQEELGQLQELKFTHIIPWSYAAFNRNKVQKDSKSKSAGSPMPPREHSLGEVGRADDEYMIHSYGKFQGKWYHIDVVVTEDNKGDMLFRRFFIMEIPSEHRMPEGVVC